MDEVWERAVETALDGQTDCSSARSLTLDGVVKCLHGRLPPPSLLEKFHALEHLSIANIGLSSLDKFPRLPNLQKLILSDNRIAGGLEFLVEAGLASLRDLDLSNNRIQFVEDLAPLAQLKLVSLDLYECPVTRVKDYRSRVFAMIRSLKYLDKMDADDNERPESDEEEEEEEDDEEDDPGSGEIDGEDRSGRSANGRTDEGVVDADDDEESDADEEETATNGSERAQHHLTNGFRVAAASVNGDDDEEDAEDEEEDDLGEEIDEDDGEDEDVVEVHEIDDSDEDEDGVEEDEEDEDDEDEDEEDVEDEEEAEEPGSTGRLTSTEGEIDGHDQGEEDENGEIGEEDNQGIEEEGEYEEDDGEGEDEVRFLSFPPSRSSSSSLQFPFVFLWCYENNNNNNDDDDDDGDEDAWPDFFYFCLFLHFQSKSCLYKCTEFCNIVNQPLYKSKNFCVFLHFQLKSCLYKCTEFCNIVNQPLYKHFDFTTVVCNTLSVFTLIVWKIDFI